MGRFRAGRYNALMAKLLDIEAPAASPGAPDAFALWHLGLRPFFLVASAFASLSITPWAAQYAGWFRHPYLESPMWHAQEMIFGCALAVIAGCMWSAAYAIYAVHYWPILTRPRIDGKPG